MTGEPPLPALLRAIPQLPPRLQEAARFVARHEFDVTTRSMRDMAAAAGTQPATFTRLAQALGYPGWEGLREALTEARRPPASTPFSGRVREGDPAYPGHGLPAAMLESDREGLASLLPGPIAAAAETLHAAPRIWVAGFRSCRGVAQILAYQLRLFRPDGVRLVGGEGPEDLDIGTFRAGDAVVLVSFAPYSRSIVLAARTAREVGCEAVVLVDTPHAPVAEGARHLLLFEAASGPSFFPSLTGALATAQALAAAVFALGGEGAMEQLRRSEARLASLSAYILDSATDS